MLKALLCAACLTGAAFSLAQVAKADNLALYGTAIPEDAVFIRWLDAPAAAQAFGAQFDAGLADSTAFVPVSGALLQGVTPGAFYSVTAEGIVQEPARDNPAKVYLILLNADSAPARLVVAGQNAEVIGETGTGTAQSRGVNPVAAQLAVMSGQTVLGSFDLTLRRGQDVTFYVRNGAVFVIETSFAPVATPN